MVVLVRVISLFEVNVLVTNLGYGKHSDGNLNTPWSTTEVKITSIYLLICNYRDVIFCKGFHLVLVTAYVNVLKIYKK